MSRKARIGNYTQSAQSGHYTSLCRTCDDSGGEELLRCYSKSDGSFHDGCQIHQVHSLRRLFNLCCHPISVLCNRGQYKSLQALRQDFELMCLNALVFNKVGDEYWREARSFFMLGSQLFDSQERKSHSTTYATEIAQIFADSVSISDWSTKGFSVCISNVVGCGCC